MSEIKGGYRMIRKQTLYCLGCGQLISREKANKTFRTGFYRVIYPLAVCNDCAKKDGMKEQELYEAIKLPYTENTIAETHITI
jgi:hypothetical protein